VPILYTYGLFCISSHLDWTLLTPYLRKSYSWTNCSKYFIALLTPYFMFLLINRPSNKCSLTMVDYSNAVERLPNIPHSQFWMGERALCVKLNIHNAFGALSSEAINSKRAHVQCRYWNGSNLYLPVHIQGLF